MKSWVVVLTLLFALAGVGLAACSSSEDPAAPRDGGPDGKVDAAVDAGDASDGSRGRCSPVQGPACDLVLQDCAAGSECIVVDSASGPTTGCVPKGTGNLPAGAKCCPDQENPCAGGLLCVGACSGGEQTGRCTPRCCPGDDGICGSSSEGYPGACELSIVDQGQPLYHVCAYKPACKPFKIQPCAAGQTCLLHTDNANYRCSGISNPPANPAGQPCSLGDECEDGLACLGPQGAALCRYLCYRDGGTPPFDPSAIRNEPGRGGCPGGGACSGSITGAPSYLGFCP